MSFDPKLNVMPANQRALWPALKQVPASFVLYGGTALALRLGHRASVDFDFFANAPVDPEALLNQIGFLSGAEIRQKSPNTLTVSVGGLEPVKVSFFGLNLRRVDDPEWTTDKTVRVAGLRDIAGCKMAVVQTRAEAKDYLDVYALLKAGISLKTMLGAAQAIYGEQFQPAVTLKALCWYGDGDLLSLPEQVKQALSEAAAELAEIEDLVPLPGGVAPVEG